MISHSPFVINRFSTNAHILLVPSRIVFPKRMIPLMPSKQDAYCSSGAQRTPLERLPACMWVWDSFRKRRGYAVFPAGSSACRGDFRIVFLSAFPHCLPCCFSHDLSESRAASGFPHGHRHHGQPSCIVRSPSPNLVSCFCLTLHVLSAMIIMGSFIRISLQPLAYRPIVSYRRPPALSSLFHVFFTGDP